MRILVRRAGALGDVILATPVVRRLRRENPESEIVVQTAYPDVFRNSPHVSYTVDPHNPSHGPYDQTIALDLVYERRPGMHVVEAYMLEAFGDRGEPADRQQELFYDRRPRLSPGGRPCVAVHAAKAGWRNRTLPEATWLDVCERLKAEGLQPILVGSARDALPAASCPSFHVPDILAQAQVVASCACFVGSDSGLLHAAGATSTPIVGIFTCARPERRLPYRDGVRGLRCKSVVPYIDCIGCLERREPPVTTEACERGDVACVGKVKAEAIVHAVMQLIGTKA